jgi:hypothetical protein
MHVPHADTFEDDERRVAPFFGNLFASYSASGKNRCRQLDMHNVRACRSGQCLTPKFVCNETGGLSSTPDYFVEFGPRIVLG